MISDAAEFPVNELQLVILLIYFYIVITTCVFVHLIQDLYTLCIVLLYNCQGPQSYAECRILSRAVEFVCFHTICTLLLNFAEFGRMRHILVGFKRP